MSEYKTCTHTYDSGRTCKSAAAKDRDYCGYHLRYRGRLLRMAQSRARHQRWDITLPPLDSLCSIHSALSQVAEALAADMIDPRRAQGLLKALRMAKENLKDIEHWHDTPYHNEDAGAYDNFEAEYGLPLGVDLNAPPEVAFPPPHGSSGFSSRAQAAASAAAVEGPAFSGAAALPDLSPMPTVAYCKDGPGCPEHTIRADFPVTPETVEIYEVLQTEGSDAAARRGNQLERNRQRRQQHSDRKRYAAIALERNMRIAAEKLAEQKLAAETAAANAQPVASPAQKKPPTSIDNSSLESARKLEKKAIESIA